MMIPSIRAPAGVSGGTLDLFGEQLATVKLDDRPKFGAAAPGWPVARSTDRCPSSSRSNSLWARSKPIVEGVLMSIPGPLDSEPARCPRPHLSLRRQAQESFVQRPEDPVSAVLPVESLIRRATSISSFGSTTAATPLSSPTR
jgi:hypothetical protein